MADHWYFAYGSNMDPDRKESRTGAIREARVARLQGYRIAFSKDDANGGAYASIELSADSEVWGVCFLCDDATMGLLDEHEGVRTEHYHRTTIVVFDCKGAAMNAQVYVSHPKRIVHGRYPTPDYLRRIERGARHWQLPKTYQRLLTAIGTRPLLNSSEDS
jgi:gamma-glutamylcyclotransferase